mmetsp:Transcript_29289/g.92417  ORF Transcript_29289/g.92417 Transcript_29289/m.92417 type:complete len:216 (-) Transcript_29289:83-730(-)
MRCNAVNAARAVRGPCQNLRLLLLKKVGGDAVAVCVEDARAVGGGAARGQAVREDGGVPPAEIRARGAEVPGLEDILGVHVLDKDTPVPVGQHDEPAGHAAPEVQPVQGHLGELPCVDIEAVEDDVEGLVDSQDDVPRPGVDARDEVHVLSRSLIHCAVRSIKRVNAEDGPAVTAHYVAVHGVEGQERPPAPVRLQGYLAAHHLEVQGGRVQGTV